MTTYIYALRDPETYACRYVGKTLHPLRRWTRHVSDARKGGALHRNRWLRSLKEKPILEILEMVEEDWQGAEQWWISEMLRRGYDLTNRTQGGDGVTGGTPWNKGRVFRPKQMSLGLIRGGAGWNKGARGGSLTSEHKQHISEGMRRHHSTAARTR